MATPNLFVATERCLICAPFGKDAFLLEKIIREESLSADSSHSLDELASSFDPSDTALILLVEEVLGRQGIEGLLDKLRQQPPWSDVPVILFTTNGERISESGARLVEMFDSSGNITMLERPLRVQTLVSTIRSAVRARLRQYQVRDLMLERERDASALRESKTFLEQRVRARTSELIATNNELEREVGERARTEKVLRQLNQKIVTLQDEERRRIARELHDSVGQSLALISMQISRLERTQRPEIKASVEEVRKLVSDTIKEVRTISHLLHPPLLDEMGLSSALRWFVDEFSKRSDVSTELDIPQGLTRMGRETETTVFRIVQEGLTNIHRHAAAQKARIAVELDASMLRLTISDNGQGMTSDRLRRASAGQSGVGITGMRERVTQLGGRFKVSSGQQGTTVSVELPVQSCYEERRSQSAAADSPC
jgi:signal transduction histidine kinase